MKIKNFLTVLSFLFPLAFSTYAQAEPMRSGDQAPIHEVFLSVPFPPKDRLTPVSFLPIIAKGKILGALVVYDDPMTKRPADYLELYDNAGTVLAIGWFDRFGIERMAVDRALVEDADELEGVFVLILEGDAV